MFKKVKSQKLYINIVEQIKQLIKTGDLQPGDQLPTENELAEKFNVSRPLVREALCALEILGITESRRGKGNFIRDSLNNLYIIQEIEELAKEADPIELLEARKAVETTITGIAATKAKEKDWLNLYKIFNDIKKDKNDISSIMKLDKKLHISIAKIADNSMLFAIMIFLTEGKNGKLWKKFEEKSWATPNRFEKYSKEHEKIIIAIKDNNKTKAEEAMNKHISGMKKDWFGFK